MILKLLITPSYSMKDCYESMTREMVQLVKCLPRMSDDGSLDAQNSHEA